MFKLTDRSFRIMDWRQRRAISYQVNTFDDVNLDVVYNSLSGDELADQVISFFKYGSQLIYPAKSYFVAIVYASLFATLMSEGIIVDEEVSDIIGSSTGYSVNMSGAQFNASFAGHTMRAILNIDDLLPDDKYYVPYYKDSGVYDEVFYRFAQRRLNPIFTYAFESAESTVRYFIEEFMLPDDVKKAIFESIEHSRNIWREEIELFYRQ